jgi:diadenosine tetraphosphate (Ap4A) HIT family hydrolase
MGSMHELLVTVKDMLNGLYQPDGYNILANCGSVAGQSIRHFHLHVIPRYQDDNKTNLIDIAKRSMKLKLSKLF